MDFSDQIALAARLAGERPEVGELERAKFRVVLLDEYQDTSVAQALMLSRLFSGARGPADGRRPPGDRGRRPQPGDLRLARGVGVQHPRVRPGVPGRRGRAAHLPAHRQPPLGRPDPGHGQPPGRRPLRRAARACSPWRPSPARPTGRSSRRPRDLGRGAARSRRPGCCARPRRRHPVARDRRADPRQHPRRGRLRRADRPRDPGRDRRASRACSGCPRWPRWWPPSRWCRTSPTTPPC